MEKIYRQINLEQARNRLVNMLPYYYINKETNTCDLVQNQVNKKYIGDEYSWGGYCTDILFPVIWDTGITVYYRWATDLNSIYNFPIYDIETKSKNGTTRYFYVRYKNIMSMYYWLFNTFIPSINFYKKCRSGLKGIIVKDRKKIFETDIPIYNYLGDVDVNNLELGEIIGVSSLYNELLNKFIDIETVKRFLKTIDIFMKQGIVEPLLPASEIGEEPYLDLSFSITTTGIDMGLMTPIIEEWVPKKRYYLGDYVMHDGKIYQLINTNLKIRGDRKYELVETEGELLQMILDDTDEETYVIKNSVEEIPEKAYSLNTTLNKQKQYVLQEEGKYYLFYPYFSGFYSHELRKVLFDYVDIINKESDNNSKRGKISKYWKEVTIKHEGVNGIINEDKEYSGITESRLLTLKRKVISVDDYGELLPFILEDDNPNNEFGQIPYMFGVANKIKNDDGTYTVDEIIQIRYRETENDEWITIDPSVIYPNSSNFDSGGTIEFTYIVGGTYKSDGTYDLYTGVKYVDEWNYTKKTMSVIINGSEYSFEYIEISPILIESEMYGNIDINNKKPIYSLATYYEKSLKNTNYLPCVYIKEEELLGIQDINKLEYDLQSRRYVSSINTFIERGKAGAFERHQILGEIKTFADLENYRNNFFEI